MTGNGSRPQERSPLPGTSPGLVVALGRSERVDEWSARPFGPESKVDAPAHAVVGDVLERRDEALCDAREMLVQRLIDDDAILDDVPLVRLVEGQEVDVASAVELAATELAHA